MLVFSGRERGVLMPDADLDRIIYDLRRKREQLTDMLDRLLIRRGDDEPAREAGSSEGRDESERPMREEPPGRS